MKIFRYILFIMTTALILQSCGSTKEVTQAQLSDKWVLKSMNNRNANELFTDKTPTLIFNFNTEQISGNGGCNTYIGKFTYNKGELRAPNLALTQMACIGENNESEFINLLGNASKLSIMNGDLIFSQNNRPVLIFYRAKVVTASELSGSWKLQTMDGKDAMTEFKGKVPTMMFSFTDNKITGNAGCNDYNTTFTLSNNVLEIGPFITTRMNCENMEAESKFINMLPGRVDIDFENNLLTIRKGNKAIMTFRR